MAKIAVLFTVVSDKNDILYITIMLIYIIWNEQKCKEEKIQLNHEQF